MAIFYHVLGLAFRNDLRLGNLQFLWQYSGSMLFSSTATGFMVAICIPDIFTRISHLFPFTPFSDTSTPSLLPAMDVRNGFTLHHDVKRHLQGARRSGPTSSVMPIVGESPLTVSPTMLRW